MDPMTPQTTTPSRGRRLAGLAGNLALGAGALLAALMLVPGLLGYERYVITGGSMEPTIGRGAVVFDDRVPVEALRAGDVITYTAPGHAPGSRVTHRITAVGGGPDGARVFRTKGDANRAADPWRFTLAQREQARVAFQVPYLGYAFAALDLRPVRMLLVGVPALLVGLALLGGLWREAGANATAVGRHDEVAAA